MDTVRAVLELLAAAEFLWRLKELPIRRFATVRKAFKHRRGFGGINRRGAQL